MKVLLVDDDFVLLDVLEEFLKEEHIETRKAISGSEALNFLQKESFDIMILDVNMPSMDGFEVLKRINALHQDLPVIMLTAKRELPDRIVGLELGADDYVIKPFDLRELLARIKAVTRRSRMVPQKKETAVLPEDAVDIDPGKREVRKGGKQIPLTSVEFEILLILAQNEGKVLTRERIMDLARSKDFMAFDRSIDMHISHLRKKLEDDPKNPMHIKTIRGAGYLYAGGA